MLTLPNVKNRKTHSFKTQEAYLSFRVQQQTTTTMSDNEFLSVYESMFALFVKELSFHDKDEEKVKECREKRKALEEKLFSRGYEDV